MTEQKTKRLADIVAADWVEDSAYYDGAEAWVGKFWDYDVPGGNFFRPLFDKMDTSNVVELACGHGRNSWQMRDWSNHKTLVDVVPLNIEFCRKRFARIANVKLVQNNGTDLSALKSGAYSALFTYDSMVHFDHTVIYSYLMETARILQPGGRALFHHSNYGANPGGDYRTNPSWRNFMPPGLFVDYAIKAGLDVKEHHIFSWGSHHNTDAVTLVQRNT